MPRIPKGKFVVADCGGKVYDLGLNYNNNRNNYMTTERPQPAFFSTSTSTVFSEVEPPSFSVTYKTKAEEKQTTVTGEAPVVESSPEESATCTVGAKL
jgi:hypothetical protein